MAGSRTLSHALALSRTLGHLLRLAGSHWLRVAHASCLFAGSVTRKIPLEDPIGEVTSHDNINKPGRLGTRMIYLFIYLFMDLWGHDHRSINPYRMPLVFNSFSFEMFWFWIYFPHVRHKCVYYLTTKTKITDSSFFSPSSPLRPDRISVMFSFQHVALRPSCPGHSSRPRPCRNP